MVPTSSPLSLVLDYGADAQICSEAFELSERGMCFNSRWKFEIGTQLHLVLVRPCAVLGRCRTTLEGIVVWCEEHPDKSFQSTVLFLELPEDLKPRLREFSHQIAAT